MIGFVERLPAEWESQWKLMQTRSSHNLELEEGKYADKQTILLLILLKVCRVSKLEQKFARMVPDPTFNPLLHVIQGLMRFLPSSRLTAEEALDLLGNTE